jgi:hypothetical protein
LIRTAPADVHVKVWFGDVLVWSLNNARKRVFYASLRGANWHAAKGQDDIVQKFQTTVVCAVGFEGMTGVTAARLHDDLSDFPGYLGYLDVDSRIRPQWGLYPQGLIPMFRVLGRELRVFNHAKEEGCDFYLTLQMMDLPFERFEIEEIGLLYSVFDPHDTFEIQMAIATVTEFANRQLDRDVAPLMLRLREVDARLLRTLAAGVDAARPSNDPERAAHIAVSCSRFTHQLANAIYPPREPKGDRKLDEPAYKNRLWAYIEENLPAGSEANDAKALLTKLGKSVDAADESANKGVHASISGFEAIELIRELLDAAGAILQLNPMPLMPISIQRRKEFDDFLALGRSRRVS